jgi:hypothetical protein
LVRDELAAEVQSFDKLRTNGSGSVCDGYVRFEKKMRPPERALAGAFRRPFLLPRRTVKPGCLYEGT